MKLENPSRYILAVLAAEGQIEADSRFGILTWVCNAFSSDAAFWPAAHSYINTGGQRKKNAFLWNNKLPEKHVSFVGW